MNEFYYLKMINNLRVLYCLSKKLRNILLILLIVLISSSENFSQVNSKLYIEDANVTGIKKFGDELWVATYGNGVFKYSLKDDKWTNFSTKSGSLNFDFFYTIEVNKDYVWAGSSEGLFIYNKKRNNWRRRRFAQGGQWGNWIRSLLFDKSQNILWIGRFIDLTKLDVKRNRYTDYDISINKDPKSNNIKTIALDGDSLIWFGTESGVHIFNKKKDPADKNAWRYINNRVDAGFNGDGDAVSVSDILFEGSHIWFATDEFITRTEPEFNIGGIYRFNRKFRWDRISTTNGLPANGVYCLERTGNQIWASLYSFDRDDKTEYGKGLVIINRSNGKVTPVDLNKINIETAKISCLYFDGTYLWLGTDKGLNRILIANPLAEWSDTKTDDKKALKKHQ
jgi:ligand-binding sensor domain-containing protein